MTTLGSVPVSGGTLYVYDVLNASGTHNISCTQSNSSSYFDLASASYNGVKQTGNPEQTGTSGPTGNQASFSQTATSTSDNDWGIWGLGMEGSTITAGANTTLRTTGSVNIASVLDTGGPIHPAGSVTMNANGNGPTPWSGVTASFAPAPATTTQLSSGVQNLAYAYDPLGNITQIIDATNDGKSRTINYTYDALSRLTSASSSFATSSPNYLSTYSYDALGNIVSGPLGLYSYQGNTGALFANPDAVTSIRMGSSTPGSIAFDSQVIPACNDTQGTSCTWSHTVSGSNTLLVVSDLSLFPDSSTGCTWNGSAMTTLGSVPVSGGTLYVYDVLNASGTHNISCTQSNSSSYFDLASASYNGVKQTGNPEQTGTSGPTGNQASFSQTATSTSDNDWGIWGLGMEGSTITAGANTTLRTTGSVNIASVLDTGGPIHPAGSVTMNANGNGPTPWSGVTASFAPAPATTTYSGPSSNFAYDNNGNLISNGTTTFVYDYKNELTAAGNGHATTTFAYDYLGNRIETIDASGTTTVFPTTLFNKVISGSGTTTWATTTKQLFLPGGSNPTLVATVETTGTATTTRYILTDHLGSPVAILNASTTVQEALDYLPYGAPLTDTTFNGYVGEPRKYIGQVYDPVTSLSYLNARYLNGSQGQFVSQDPVFLGSPRQQNLQDPQSLNSYSYSEDNPIVKSDPNGRIAGWDDAIASGIGGIAGFDFYTLSTAITNQPMTGGDALSAFTVGAMLGEGIDNAPETGGTSIEIALSAIRAAANRGASASLAGNASKQALNVITGAQTGVNYGDFATSLLSGYAEGGIFEGALSDASVCVPGLTCGQNSWSATSKGLATRFSNGEIQSVSTQSSFKAAFSSQINNSLISSSGAVFSAGYSKQSQPSQSSSGYSAFVGLFNPFIAH